MTTDETMDTAKDTKLYIIRVPKNRTSLTKVKYAIKANCFETQQA